MESPNAAVLTNKNHLGNSSSIMEASKRLLRFKYLGGKTLDKKEIPENPRITSLDEGKKSNSFTSKQSSKVEAKMARAILAEKHPLVVMIVDLSFKMDPIKTVLDQHKIEFQTIRDGSRAIEQYKLYSNHLRVILLDLDMPSINAFQATTQIRKYEKENHLKPAFICGINCQITSGNGNFK